jgi:ribonuclease HI
MSKPSQPKYYVVWKGRKPGIYHSWAACEAQVKGFTGAQYKAFPARAEAERAWQTGYHHRPVKPATGKDWLFSPHPPIAPSYCVDAACSGNPGRLEYRGVELSTGKIFFHQGPFEHGTNNIGEFLAIVEALQWLKRKKDASAIYSDSQIAIGWVKKKTSNTQLAQDKHNAILFDLIAKAETWLEENSYKNPLLKWDTQAWGEIPADFNRK